MRPLRAFLIVAWICVGAAAPAAVRCAGGRDASENRCVAPEGAAKFGWPAAGKIVVASCDSRDGAGDIVLALRRGDEIHAAESGRVVYAGHELKGFDEVVFIRHRGEWVSAYALSGTLLVRRGDVVQRGEALARIDGMDSAGAFNLHFALRWRAASVPPLDFLEPSADRLKVRTLCGG